MNLGKIIWAVLVVVLLPACALNEPYVIEETKTVGSSGSDVTITVIDQRPDSDKEFDVGSFMVFKSDYGIMTLGDKSFSPQLDHLLKIRLHRGLSTWGVQPEEVRVTLKRMLFQANHQADLLQGASTSSGIGPLGVLIAETMHGKEFELDYDKTRPFVIGFVTAVVDLSYKDGKKVSRDLSVSSIENFSNHMDAKAREVAAISVTNKIFDTFVVNLAK
jgi:hypothetical protein